MKQPQPAKINYFFKKGYEDLWGTITDTFSELGDQIGDAFSDMVENFSDFFSDFFDTIMDLIDLDIDIDDIWESIAEICKASFSLGKFLFIVTLTPLICIAFSILHVTILFLVMSAVYLFFAVLLLADKIYRGVKKISNICPECQRRFELPVYVCPSCGAEHTKLVPGKYGILKRTCNCGTKLPTTFFNGRQKLEGRCPYGCRNHVVADGGNHVEICIPVIGGADSGKTCLITQSIVALENAAPSWGLEYEYASDGNRSFKNDAMRMRAGSRPDKTQGTVLKYNRFYLTPKGEKVRNLISICDVSGEVYADSATLGQQIGFRYANALMIVLDPLSLPLFREEISRRIDVRPYQGSAVSIDDVVGRVVTLLENLYSVGKKDTMKTKVAVAITKCDMPGVRELIGEDALNDYMAKNPKASRAQAMNCLAEQFLNRYGGVNFLNQLRSRFSSGIRFFPVSALGHIMNGKPFTPSGVEEPICWLLDQTHPSYKLCQTLYKTAGIRA